MQTEKSDTVYDVLVIGAGWSGLLACKYCVQEGLRTIVLEKRNTLGGVWTYTDDTRYGGVMKSTATTSSKCITEMSDFPMPNDYPDFPRHTQIRDYLDGYCQHFELSKHIKTGIDVTQITKDGGLWKTYTTEGKHYFSRRVIVSTGVHQHPNNVLDNYRFVGFTGDILHSSQVKEISDKYKGKTIVVWGGGESASDIAYETSLVAKKVYFCIPRGQWFVPKVVESWPPFPSARPKIVDHTSSRLRLFLSPTDRYSPFIAQYLQLALGFNGHGQPAWKTAAPYNRSFFNKSAAVLTRLKSGHVIAKRDIKECFEDRVRFTDGHEVVADQIIACSGYTIRFPFLSSDLAPCDPKGWYKYIFSNEDPSLAFVGFARPVFGSIPGLAELQARLIAKVFKGTVALPPKEYRSTIIRMDTRFWNYHFRHTSLRIGGLVDHFRYCDQIATMIGCRPNFGKLLFINPRLWWRAITAPWNGCQFWLNERSHHERIFNTFKRYNDNRISQIYVFMALAPILPFIGLYQQSCELLRERFDVDYRNTIHERVINDNRL